MLAYENNKDLIKAYMSNKPIENYNVCKRSYQTPFKMSSYKKRHLVGVVFDDLIYLPAFTKCFIYLII